MIGQIKTSIVNNLKNSIGWKTKRKIIVFAVDDYGNVRLDSAQARTNMDNIGMKIYSRFDALDTLETSDDLSALYEVLSSVKDGKGKSAVFTPYSLPCNIDFESMENEGYEMYRYETLPKTYKKLEQLQPNAYLGAWKLWQEGISNGLMKPQFHGREHLNLTLFNEKLQARDAELLMALKNRSYTSISDDKYPTISSTASFDFWEFKENENFIPIIEDGLKRFEAVFGYQSDCFTPPVFNIHNSLFITLEENGIKYIDLGLIRKEHQGLNKYKTEFNYTGKTTQGGLKTIVRNVVFEPTEDRGLDWVVFGMKQIETAFRWNKPAIISSHRVNFCGHIDEDNRKKGLSALKQLLDSIVKKWPEVEFLSASELGKIINNKEK